MVFTRERSMGRDSFDALATSLRFAITVLMFTIELGGSSACADYQGLVQARGNADWQIQKGAGVGEARQWLIGLC